MSFRVVNPQSLGVPRGFNHGMLAPADGRVLLVAGQNAGAQAASGAMSFAKQFEVTLGKVLEVVREAGGNAEHIGRLTIYVTDMQGYLAARPALGAVYRKLMGRHYPAMALVEVKSLVDEGAQVEIEATAVIP